MPVFILFLIQLSLSQSSVVFSPPPFESNSRKFDYDSMLLLVHNIFDEACENGGDKPPQHTEQEIWSARYISEMMSLAEKQFVTVAKETTGSDAFRDAGLRFQHA